MTSYYNYTSRVRLHITTSICKNTPSCFQPSSFQARHLCCSESALEKWQLFADSIFRAATIGFRGGRIFTTACFIMKPFIFYLTSFFQLLIRFCAPIVTHLSCMFCMMNHFYFVSLDFFNTFAEMKLITSPTTWTMLEVLSVPSSIMRLTVCHSDRMCHQFSFTSTYVETTGAPTRWQTKNKPFTFI